ncbi:PREDICTED: glycine receptor subunit alpha-4 isoform X2 [Nicrophorus vespilloides]|uniref:Glycine receptor subunit alpha-4 isoform X2 n=1 Tax=Nicrophorus vespilloides TaxID=110193 RepID=A0ABM1N198_NICVS|nr:PREDICTED: glycine receptor subunit alpha-4 isoform X2 [Nicrophorus vespilloides]
MVMEELANCLDINVSWLFSGLGNAIIPKQAKQFHKPKSILPEHYLKVRPPTYKGKPLKIEFSMTVVDINSINVEDMDFRMDMFLRQQWTDTRLQIPEEIFEYGDEYVTLPTHIFNNLWQPDLYFLNSKVVEIATLTHKFSSVTLYRNKTVRYSARMHAIVACQMEFQYYPMDIQICPLSIESFSYDNSKMGLKWSDTGVVVSPELKLLQYHIAKPLVLEESDIYTNEKNGNFSRLVVNFRFERQIGHHLIQTFAPSTLVVVVSWFSFWLSLDAVPGRVTLLVTCLLTLVTMFTGLRSDIPPVAYVKAIDLWMAGCMIFVFSALSEFVIVKVLEERYKVYKQKELSEANIATQWCTTLAKSGKSTYTHEPNTWLPLCWKTKNGVEKVLWCEIDRMSRSIFPVLFLIFLVVYWPLLITGKSSPILIV